LLKRFKNVKKSLETQSAATFNPAQVTDKN